MILHFYLSLCKVSILTFLFTLGSVEAIEFDLVKGIYAQFEIVSKIHIFRLTDSIGDLKQQKFLKLFTTLDNREILSIEKLFQNGDDELFEIDV